MNEVVFQTPYRANRYMTTTCTKNGYGYDDLSYQNGAWTYWFWREGYYINNLVMKTWKVIFNEPHQTIHTVGMMPHRNLMVTLRDFFISRRDK
ncbi:MAG: hypothetical protein J7L63_04175 [Thermoplasmata archaeon]|nr:hypothetical protein [Thermoplasmata archaeon]